MKCQNCAKTSTVHITEVLRDNQFEELHLCEDCAAKFMQEPTAVQPIIKQELEEPADESIDLTSRQCEVCGLKFVEFRNTGRLGCPHDYTAFQAELAPLLEGIHGATKHTGKIPRRLPQTRVMQQELVKLRKQLYRAVADEAYEEAARLRDRIREIEETV